MALGRILSSTVAFSWWSCPTFSRSGAGAHTIALGCRSLRIGPTLHSQRPAILPPPLARTGDAHTNNPLRPRTHGTWAPNSNRESGPFALTGPKFSSLPDGKGGPDTGCGRTGGKRLDDLDPRAGGSTAGLTLGGGSRICLLIPDSPKAIVVRTRLTHGRRRAKFSRTRRQMDRTQKPIVSQDGLHAEHGRSTHGNAIAQLSALILGLGPRELQGGEDLRIA